MKFTSVSVVSALAATASAHGYVQQILLGENLVSTWNPYKDASKKVNKITRKFRDNGPVTDGLFTTDAITCNIASDKNNVPSTETASVPAGSNVKFMWTEWKSDHPGPIMTYLADCGGKCSEFDGSKGNVWVKIDQSGYDANEAIPWASKRLPEQNSTYTIKLPATIAPGEYILRHEILGLQRTNKDGNLAQFYPGCHQITVTGGGATKLPEGIALPGAYKADDTESIFLDYRKVTSYTPPGGPVWGDDGWAQ
ncbi:family 61 endoglucanase [Colletotrichum higginsianum]|uniref:lytic cellulose monooxygenase (C4-dehydrogenating) n=2 Tax=Colletotrichum destructivum species complex TaxID=2707350 RepID=H1V8J9_COLHI|nr:Family 61 endoglucanase [Colletotrichum higginsianum IMI 349063]OBR05450.1 Family 61 endoglucanase [Colletotrichum higginsianum IMI 349063]WQF85399.1 Putative auxiliary Activity family 9 [Colletotrichum destructivum]CCF36552.1 family 61 endoglucanase [Colletotrichum higginsianum]